MEENRIEIPFSKSKLLLGLIGCVLFEIFCFWLIAGGAYRQARYDPDLLFLGGIVGIVFFGFAFVFILKKLRNNAPAIIIDQHGITDYSSAVSVGLIEWDDITGIRKLEGKDTKAPFLLIDTALPDKYIAKAGSKIKAGAMKVNKKLYGSPLTIGANGLSYDIDELKEAITEAYASYKIIP